MLTGDKNIDRIIFLKLSDKDLRNVFQLNSQFWSLSSDETLWMQKCLKRFDPKKCKDLKNLGKSLITWKNIYMVLHNEEMKEKKKNQNDNKYYKNIIDYNFKKYDNSLIKNYSYKIINNNKNYNYILK